MKTSVDHLPPAQQDELEHVKRILLDEFASATSRATQPWKKNGRIQNIILFGSYARDDWVDEPENGYQSDFDVLVIVSHKDLTDVTEYWYAAEDKIERDPRIARPVNVIVHTLEEVNQGLARGEYFWVDIARDGIVLYELPGSVLATPKPRTAAEAYDMAGVYLAEWLGKVDTRSKDRGVLQSRREEERRRVHPAPGGRARLHLLPTREDALRTSIAQSKVPALAGRGQGAVADRELAAHHQARPAPL